MAAIESHVPSSVSMSIGTVKIHSYHYVKAWPGFKAGKSVLRCLEQILLCHAGKT